MVKVKIAVVQFQRKGKTHSENIERAEKFIKNASERNANIIVFPENFLSNPSKSRERIYPIGKFTGVFQKLAKKYEIDIVAGSIVEKDIKTKKNYNISYYIDSDGEVKAEYRKINLWDTEKTCICPGNKIKVFDTKFGRIGLIICWDSMFPEIFRKIFKKHTEIIICPSHWSYEDAGIGLEYDKNSEVKLIDSLCVDRAFEQEVIFVFCNTAGKIEYPHKTEYSIGHSQVTSPFKGAVKRLEHNKEQMFIVSIDTDILKDAERAYRIKHDLEKISEMNIKVSDIMNPILVSTSNITGKEAARIMSKKEIGSLIIMKKGKIEGIVTETDILKNISNLNKKITSLMSKNVTTISKDSSIDSLLRIMTEKKLKRIPVVVKGKPIGIVSMTDLFNSSGEFIKTIY